MRRQCIRYGNDKEPGGTCRLDPHGGVLEGERLLRADRQLLERTQIHLRIRLSPAHVVDGHGSREMLRDVQFGKGSVHGSAVGVRGQSYGDVIVHKKLQEGTRAGHGC
jgi:hypothetical protein